jgi:mitochondrial fission protein ELM1
MERSTRIAAAGTWTLSDGRAGNARQAQALALALGMAATEWTLQPRAPWRWLAPRHLPGAATAFGPAFAHALAQPPALAIGCGRQAALATRLLRTGGTATVQILDPRLSQSHWDVVVAPRHDGLRGDNVVQVLGSLHPVDDPWLARARAEFPALGQLPGPRVALLIGGPTRHARFDAHDVARWMDAIAAALARTDGSLMLSASRRTPPAVHALLRRPCEDMRGVCWLDERDGANPYPGLLAWADCIVCSPDSVNMLSEACATGVPVFVADPRRATGRIRAFIDALAAMGRIRPLDDALAGFPVEPLRETARVAAEVRARLNLAGVV